MQGLEGWGDGMSKKKNEFKLTTEEQVEINYILAKSYRKTTKNNLKDLVRLIDTAIKQNNLANTNYRKALLRRRRHGYEKGNVVAAWFKTLDMRCLWWHIKCGVYKILHAQKNANKKAGQSRDTNPIQWH
ncbi:MAG: hypothetical protein IT212_12800 [Bacteroidia bacterium]|nr:hypothetical protein [Bacteroidia bacterium]